MAIATSAQLARALYDNTAESPQELSFRRGDVLRVLRGEGAAGLRGWCLCSLHGRRGIVPANRVELLPAGPAPPARPGSPRPAPQRQEEEREVYVVPPPARPCPPSPDPIYKVPRGHGTQPAAPGEGLEVYDVPSAAPRPRPSSPYDSPASFARPAPAGEDEAPYDVPLAPKPPPELEEGREPGPPFHAAPSNLRRASALLNLYEAPEELLASGDADEGIYEVPLLGPDAPSPEPPAAAAPLLARSPPPARRPRLPSAESLSRRPLPALPVPEPPSPAPARKGSIQDRPLPPPPPRLPIYGAPEADGEPAGPEAEAGPVAPHNEYEGIPTAEEYDYVHLKGVDKTPGPRPPDKASPGDSELPDKGRPEKQETAPPREPPAAGDLQLLRFYAGQCRGHHSALQGAVAALLASTRAGQPPGLFVPLGKQVAVAAHRLVFVGDALGRLAAAARVRAQVGAAGAALGRALRGAVLAVKGAALGYPSSAAAQELARCVADLAGEAQRFTTLLARLAS